MKTLVVYRSHYGSTRRYAQWLAQALDADAAEERQADARLVQNYECVIFGGGLYAGSIAGAAYGKAVWRIAGETSGNVYSGAVGPERPGKCEKDHAGCGPGLYAGNAGEYLLFPPARRDGLPEYEACTQGDDGNAEKNAAEKTGERAKYGRKRAAGRI